MLSSDSLNMIMADLKDCTRDAHARVENTVDLSTALASIDDYAGLLVAFYGVYSPLEASLAPWLCEADIAFRDRCKCVWLEADLRFLGYDFQALSGIATCAQLPSIESAADAWGCLYVLEGSTLGGQVIQRQVAERYGLTPDRGVAFFSGYRDKTAAMWRQFGLSVTDFSRQHPESNARIVKAAQETFHTIEEWFHGC